MAIGFTTTGNTTTAVPHRCPICDKEIVINNFRDEKSRKEYAISGLCQSCQDDIFKDD